MVEGIRRNGRDIGSRRRRAFGARCMAGIGVLVGLLAMPGTLERAFAAPAASDATNPMIIPIPAVTVASTTPNACNGAANTCAAEVLGLINADRAAHGLAPLVLTAPQSNGTGGCVGSYGHSLAMAKSSAIWHVNPRYPRASFPHSICVKYLHAAENVGEDASGNVHNDLRTIESLMMSEPHGHATCAGTVNHACNILNPAFKRVGIGVEYSGNGVTWLTEDFTG